jgi:hypothetical protein
MSVQPPAHIFVDDSGSLYDPAESVVTVVAIVTQNPVELQWIVRRVRRHVKRHRKSHAHAEFKFYNTASQARGRVLAGQIKMAKTEGATLGTFVHSVPGEPPRR